MRGCFVLPSTPGKRVCRPFRRKRVMHRAGAEAAGARRRDAAEAPRDRVRAGAVCHAASGAAAAPCRGAVRADDAPAGPREQASEAGRHTRRSTVPTARCQDTTAVFGSSWQVILEVWHDKILLQNPCTRESRPGTRRRLAAWSACGTNAPKRFMKRNNDRFISLQSARYFEIKPYTRDISKQNEMKFVSF